MAALDLLEATAERLEAREQLGRRADRQHRRATGGFPEAAASGHQKPLMPRRRSDDAVDVGEADELDQIDAAAFQFPGGLLPVTTVRPDPGEIRSDDQGTDRAMEARQPLAPLPVARQILG